MYDLINSFLKDPSALLQNENIMNLFGDTISKYFSNENSVFKMAGIEQTKKANIIKFKVNDERFDVYIDTINLLGKYRKSKVIEYSVHLGLKSYKITYKNKPDNDNISEISNYEFIASDDHSILVCSKDTKKIITTTPKVIAKNPSKFYFIATKEQIAKDVNFDYDEQYNDYLYLIACDKFTFEETEDEVLFDITVDNPAYKYFKLANGIFVVDTVVAHALHSEEAKKEALEKMQLSKQIAHVENYNNLTSDINKNAVFGLVYGSLDPKDVNYKPKNISIKTKFKTKDELLQLLNNVENWNPYDILNGKTIAQWLIDLTVDNILANASK